ncbi:hypothetical protein [Caballeronia sp. 15711]|uniref:hypothetical protein n=1 Tax=Caballeronia sp. 15711 TaxID=3391029 RepID=UPI0039E21995
MNNVHMIGGPRKPGRRRERPIPGIPKAEVLGMATALEKRKGTSAEQIMRLELTIHDMAAAILTAIRAARASGADIDEVNIYEWCDVDTPEGNIRHLTQKIAGMAHWIARAALTLKKIEDKQMEAKQ